MGYGLAADAVVLLHGLFVVFAAVGGLLVLRYRWVAWLHLPAAGWAVLVGYAGWICPLTPLENRLRRLGGERGYQGGFIEHYLLPVLYPEGLTEAGQVVIGTVVLLVNVAIYGWLLWRRERKEG